MKCMKALVATAVVFASLVVGAVDWQFTGATNRVSAASAQTVSAAVPFRIRITGNSVFGGFDSRWTDSEILHGCNFSSERVGLIFIVR